MIGVNKFIAHFKQEFDVEKKSKKIAKDKGVSQEEVKQEWEERKAKGTRIHESLQAILEGKPNVISFHNDFNDEATFKKLVPDEKLEDGKIYLERPCYSLKQDLIGFPDKIEVKNKTIHIQDYKSWKTVYRTAPTLKVPGKTIKPKFFPPIDHLDDCNLVEATLQLSLYMYILWENNKYLKVGDLSVKHIITNKKDEVIGEEIIRVPYLREEVNLLLKFKKLNGI